MNRIIALTSVLFAVTMLGCQPKPPNPAAVEETVALGPQYSEKKGLFVPDNSRQALGLAIVDVTEQEVAATLDIPFRVYQHSDNTALASGTITPEQATKIEAGNAVIIQEGNGGSVTGRITKLDDQFQKATGMIEVLAEIPNASSSLTIGAFLQATVALESSGSVVTVPRSALLHYSDGYCVYTVSGEHFVRTQVKVGTVNADVAEIQDGLYAGDQVVSQPVMSLWMTELAAVKGGQACCVAPPKGK